jgi:hypothetical protein
MIPREPLAPNNGAALGLLSPEFNYVPDFPKSIEEPSVAVWSSPGRGENGEHATGDNNAEELWRSLYARHKFGMK